MGYQNSGGNVGLVRDETQSTPWSMSVAYLETCSRLINLCADYLVQRDVEGAIAALDTLHMTAGPRFVDVVREEKDGMVEIKKIREKHRMGVFSNIYQEIAADLEQANEHVATWNIDKNPETLNQARNLARTIYQKMMHTMDQSNFFFQEKSSILSHFAKGLDED